MRRLTIMAALALSACGGGGEESSECDSSGECADGNPCNGDETCSQGSCVGGTPLECPPGERCDPASGCVTGCDSDRDCDDGIGCTTDACDVEAHECSFAADQSACPEGSLCDESWGCLAVECEVDGDCADDNPCNGDEACFEASCVAGVPPECERGEWCDPASGCVPGCDSDRDCDDGVACTADACNPAQHECSQLADHEACPEGSLCDVTAGCLEVECDDDGGCDDSIACNGAERCEDGRCVGGTPVDCDDEVDCTFDACREPDGECENVAVDGECDDGVYCNGAETCSPDQGGCVPADDVDCDDLNPCTSDTCDEDRGACVHPPLDADEDGTTPLSCGGTDCDDDRDDVLPGEPEVCDGVDQDCDEEVDEGVTGECGNCDLDCRAISRSTGSFVDSMVGLTDDAELGGLVLSFRAEQETEFAWVVNSLESTVSKIDLGTGLEVGRYYVGLQGQTGCGGNIWGSCNAPSRTALDSNADVYVASRGFNVQGTVTKVASEQERCVDSDLDEVIDSSSNDIPLAWGSDECILWTASVGPVGAALRAVTVDLGDEERPEGYVWAGGYYTTSFWKLDPRDGTQLAEVDTGIGAYGAVVAPDGRLWFSHLESGSIQAFDTVTGVVEAAIPRPFPWGCAGGNESYGIALDGDGRVWIGGGDCRDAAGYDPASGQWTVVDTRGYGRIGRGITVDGAGRAWMSLPQFYDQGGGVESELVYWSVDDFVPGGTIDPQALTHVLLGPGTRGPLGVGSDTQGRMWIVNLGTNNITRYDPANGDIEHYGRFNAPYTYSDFTGYIRQTFTAPVGSYWLDIDGECDGPTWGDLVFDATIPEDTEIAFTVRTGDEAADLESAADVPVATVPPGASPQDVGQALDDAGVAHARWLRLFVELRADAAGATPVLSSIEQQWTCSGL